VLFCEKGLDPLGIKELSLLIMVWYSHVKSLTWLVLNKTLTTNGLKGTNPVKKFHNWRSKSFEIARQQSNKKIPTLNINIFQFVWSKFMKFLPHELKQVKYKILWLDFKKRIFFYFLGRMEQKWQKWQFRVFYDRENGLGTIGIKHIFVYNIIKCFKGLLRLCYMHKII